MKQLTSRILIVLSAVTSLSALAATQLSANTLLTHCNAYIAEPESAEAQVCAAYVRGFLEGVKAAERGSQAMNAGQESWSDRALRTRLGHNALPVLTYCVPENLHLSQFISRMMNHIESRPESLDDSADAALESTLKVHYRCSEYAGE